MRQSGLPEANIPQVPGGLKVGIFSYYEPKLMFCSQQGRWVKNWSRHVIGGFFNDPGWIFTDHQTGANGQIVPPGEINTKRKEFISYGAPRR